MAFTVYNYAFLEFGKLSLLMIFFLANLKKMFIDQLSLKEMAEKYGYIL